MYVDFESLADSSSIWIYQSNRELSKQEVDEIKSKIEGFIGNWQRHGDDLRASYQIKYNQFIVIAVDEQYNGISGCSIDASTNLIKQFEDQYKIDLFNKMNTAFKSGEHINVVSLPDFQKYINEQKIDSETVVFNNMIRTKKEFGDSWEVPAAQSWHSRYF